MTNTTVTLTQWERDWILNRIASETALINGNGVSPEINDPWLKLLDELRDKIKESK